MMIMIIIDESKMMLMVFFDKKVMVNDICVFWIFLIIRKVKCL